MLKGILTGSNMLYRQDIITTIQNRIGNRFVPYSECTYSGFEHNRLANEREHKLCRQSIFE